MNASIKLFWLIAVFAFVASAGYTVWCLVDPFFGQFEPVGSLGLLLVGLMAVLIAFYFGRTYKAQGGELPEDRLDANIDDGDAEQGFFSPWSWWPVTLAAGAAIVFMALAVGAWIAFIGAAVVVVALVGWTYEYYRGYFAR